eukprot:SAG22_NODE_459_length_10228_cov_9.593642_2_plen_42_part_00
MHAGKQRPDREHIMQVAYQHYQHYYKSYIEVREGEQTGVTV